MAKKPAKKPAKPAAKPKGPVKAGKAAKPAAKKPAAKPAKASKPAAKPMTMAKPAKPAAKKPAAKPAKPVAKKPIAKLVPKPQPKPAAKAPAKAQPAKPAASKPVAAPAKPAAKKPAAPAPKPAPAAAKPETKAAPVAAPKPVKKETKKEKETAPKAPAQPLVTQVSAPVRPMAAPVVKKQVSTLESADKARYSDDELAEFKELILKKLEEARKDYDLLKQTLANTDNNGTDDTSPSFKMIEDGSETLSREETAQLAARQEKFIKHLEDALLRIRNKTYGICRVTGRLISKERLRLVPHATLSIEAKQQMGS